MLEIGRLCIKTQGRDAAKKCCIVEVLKDNYVLIDGNTRRRKCNMAHIEPLDKVLNIKKGASTKEVLEIFKSEKIQITKNPNEKKKTNPKPQIRAIRKGMDKKKTKKEIKGGNK
jgi:large subunit ribosomal protein L14e